MEFLLLMALIGIIPAAIARSKGRSFFGFWFYGALLFIIALPHAILAKPNLANLEAQKLSDGAHRKCPSCAEIVLMDANVCRHCGYRFDDLGENADLHRPPQGEDLRLKMEIAADQNEDAPFEPHDVYTGVPYRLNNNGTVEAVMQGARVHFQTIDQFKDVVNGGQN